MIQLIPMLLGFPLIGFWFWMLIDLSDNEYLSSKEKNDWFIKFILLNVLAAAWYYLVEYRTRHL